MIAPARYQMAQTAPSPAQTTLPTDIIRRRFTVDDYDRMAEAGILHEDDRVELIDGEIVQMAVIGPRHATSVDETVYNLSRLLPPTICA
jgi:hypothetical protein